MRSDRTDQQAPAPPDSATAVDPVRVHPMLARAFAAMDAAGIVWCVVRGESDLHDPPGDVDLLVSASDLDALDRVLAEHGFLRRHHLGAGAHRTYVGYDSVTDRWIEVDAESAITFGPSSSFLVNWLRPALYTDAASVCLARRQRRSPIWVLRPDDGFWALLLHCIVDKGAVADRHARRLQDLAGAAPPDGTLGAIVAAHCPPGWNTTRVLAAVLDGRWGELVDLGAALPVLATARQPVATRLRALGRGVHRLVDAPAGRLSGFSVALMGPDGAGKSTLAAGIAASSALPARLVYMGLWQGEGDSDESPPLTRAVLAAAGRPLKSWRRAALSLGHQTRGRLVVYDRHPYDALLPPDPPYVVAKRIFFGFLARSVPSPALVLVLDLPSEVTRERRPEEDPAQLAAARQRYLDLGRRLSQAEIIDADRPPGELRTMALDQIMRAMITRQRSGRR